MFTMDLGEERWGDQITDSESTQNALEEVLENAPKMSECSNLKFA